MIHRKGRSLRKLATVTALSLGSGSLFLLHTPASAAVGDSYSPAIETRNCTDTTFTANDFDAIQGRGASFANNLHNDATNGWIAQFNNACPTAASKVTYFGTGSGSGQRATRDRNHAFGASDEPLEASQQACYEANGTGPSSSVECNLQPFNSPGGPGQLHHFPLAVGAISMFYNAPTCFGTTAQLTLTSSQIDRIFWGVMDWGDISAELGVGVCTNQTITRCVRLDSSGTTYAFKEYMSKRQPRWRNVGPGSDGTDYLANANNTAWPDSASTFSPVVRGAVNGNAAVGDCVSATVGAIAYVELSAARKEYAANGGSASSLRWAKVASVNPVEGDVDPSLNATFAPSTSPQGSNCGDAAAGAVHPPSTLSKGWDRVTISDGPDGYPICTFTYALVYNNLRLAFNGPTGETNPAMMSIDQARTLAAYLSFGINNEPGGGQSFLDDNDYGPLPPQTQAVARAGLGSLTYNP